MKRCRPRDTLVPPVIFRFGTVLTALMLSVSIAAAVPRGPNVGNSVPDFRLADQGGTVRTLRSILGPEGALLVFYRSADW